MNSQNIYNLVTVITLTYGPEFNNGVHYLSCGSTHPKGVTPGNIYH